MFEVFLLLCLLLILICIVYTSVKIGIAPMPSSFKSAHKMNEISLSVGKNSVLDLGSGFGFLALYFAWKNPQVKIIGYETSFFPWAFSICLKYVFNCKNLYFYKENYLDIDIPVDCLIICFLFPKGMDLLEVKLKSLENRVISNTFSFKEKEPLQIYVLDDLYKTKIYLY